jgi:hypothetical protein
MKNKYEWVLTMSKGDDVVLTENQYDFYKEHYAESKVFFGDIEINPAFIVSAAKRPIYALRPKYPCKTCSSCGRLPDYTTCPICEGSGVHII